MITGIDEIISDHISQISVEWLTKKRYEFSVHPNYVKKDDKIIIVDKFLINNTPPLNLLYDSDGEFNKEFEDYQFSEEIGERVYDFDFPQYCASYLPIDESTYWGSYSFDGVKQLNIKSLSTDLSDCISDTFKFNGANVAIVFPILNEVVTRMDAAIKDEFNKNNNKDCLDVRSYFLNIFLGSIMDRYSLSIEGYYALKDKRDKLLFNLTQEEFAALLYLLDDTGILSFKSPNNLSYLDFCSSHFLCLKSGKPVSLDKKQLSNKISDIRNDTGGSGMKKIKERLHVKLRDIR